METKDFPLYRKHFHYEAHQRKPLIINKLIKCCVSHSRIMDMLLFLSWNIDHHFDLMFNGNSSLSKIICLKWADATLFVRNNRTGNNRHKHLSNHLLARWLFRAKADKIFLCLIHSNHFDKNGRAIVSVIFCHVIIMICALFFAMQAHR